MPGGGWGPRREGGLRSRGGSPWLSPRFVHSLPPSQQELIHKQTLGKQREIIQQGPSHLQSKEVSVSRLMVKRNLPGCAGREVGRNFDKQKGTVALGQGGGQGYH